MATLCNVAGCLCALTQNQLENAGIGIFFQVFKGTIRATSNSSLVNMVVGSKTEMKENPIETLKIVKATMSGIIESLPDLACIIDASGAIICANAGVVSLVDENSSKQLMITDDDSTASTTTSFYDFLSDSSISTFQDTICKVIATRAMVPSLLIQHKSNQCSSQWSLNILHGIFENYPDILILNGKRLQTSLAGHCSFLHHMNLNSSALKRSFVNLYSNKNKVCSEEVTAHHDKPLKSKEKHAPQQMHNSPTADCEVKILISSSKLHKYGQEVANKRLLHHNRSHFMSRLEELNTETNSLTEILEKKRVFVKAVAHEIRTPLNIVLSGINLLQLDQHSSNDACYQQTILDMKMACESAVDIVSDFINYEKLECDICTLEKSAINIIELVHKWVQPFRVQAKYRQIELIFIDDVQSACIAEVDEYKLSQVFRNLVSNAIKFSPAHGTVIIKMSKELNDMVRISVSDNGAGISIDNQTKLFTDIVQFNAKALQGGGGSGIGLWVSRKLMDAHGGTIGVYSAGEGLGSTFFIGLPLSHQSASVSAITKRASLQSNEPIMKNGKPLNILVVDDSVLSRKMCSKLLSKLGIHVKEAGDGTECLEEVIAATERGHCFDAILMDSSMVTMNGAEATSELRKRGYQGKIYGVTGECCESDTLAFLHAGADCIYIKPLAEDAILKILADLE